MPPDRKATYLLIVVADRPRKTETRRVRITVGGDKVDYPGEVTTKTSDMVTSKTSVQQRHLHRRRSLHDYRYQRFLPQQCLTAKRIC